MMTPEQDPNSPLRLRGYHRDDLDALFRLDEFCFAPSFRFSKRTMRNFAEADNARIVIGEIHGDLAGFCIVHLQRAQDAYIGYVVTLDVAPAHRRTGVASALMRRAEAEARAANCSLMVLHVFTGNEAAIRFYQHEGYEHVGEAKNFYGWGIDGQLYRKELLSEASGKL